MSAIQETARCPECGIPAGKHHDIGCPLPCDACESARRQRLLRDLRFAAVLGAAGAAGDWLLSWPWGARNPGLALSFGAALAVGCLFTMGRQRWIETGRKR